MTTLADLAAYHIWCAWQLAVPEGMGEDGKPTKIPCSARGFPLKWADRATWVDRETAERIAAVLPAPFGSHGIGVFLGPDKGGAGDSWLVGVDFDSCLIDGVLAPWAEAGMVLLDSYGEISPSGSGTKVFCLVWGDQIAAVQEALGIAGDRSSAIWKQAGHGRRDAEKTAGIEVYLQKRWFAVTGDEFGSSSELGWLDSDKAAALRRLADATFGPRKGGGSGGGSGGSWTGPRLDESHAAALARWSGVEFSAVPGDLSDAEVFVRARQAYPMLDKLLAGDVSGLAGDHSRSNRAFFIARDLRAFGLDWGAIVAAIAWLSEDQAVLDGWYQQKCRDGHELYNIWKKLRSPSDLKASRPTVLGPVERVVLEPGVMTEQIEVLQATALRERQEVQLRVGIATVVDEAEHAVEASGLEIFQYGERLVRPVVSTIDATDDRKTTMVGFQTLETASGIDTLSRAVRWTKWDARNKQMVPCDPTSLVAEVWLSRTGQWRVPRVKGAISAPTIRRDGSLVTQAGFDRATGLYLAPDPGLVMPAGWDAREPVKSDAMAAVGLLDELLDEFPFISAADRAVALSGLITAVVKGALRARPLHVMDAPAAGSGKSFLIKLCTLLALGREAPVVTAGPREEELEKRLGGLMLTGTPVIVIDNVNGRLEGAFLCTALDQPLLNVRQLGTSQVRIIENMTCLYADGNNIVIVGDLVRRSVVARLDAEMEHPELRVFRSNPVAKVSADRGRYIAAALTVVRAHILAGCPGAAGLRPMASFDDYTRLVRGALVWLGRADPLETMLRMSQEDPEKADLRDFARAWAMRFAYRELTVKMAVDTLDAIGGDNTPVGETPFSRDNDKLAADDENKINKAGIASNFKDIAIKIAGRNNIIDNRRLGEWLTRNENRVIDNHRFVRGRKDNRSKTQKWKLQIVTPHLKVVNSIEG